MYKYNQLEMVNPATVKTIVIHAKQLGTSDNPMMETHYYITFKHLDQSETVWNFWEEEIEAMNAWKKLGGDFIDDLREQIKPVVSELIALANQFVNGMKSDLDAMRHDNPDDDFQKEYKPGFS